MITLDPRGVTAPIPHQTWFPIPPRNGSLHANHENDLNSTFAPLLRVVIDTFGRPPRQSTLFTSRLAVGGFNNAVPLPWSGGNGYIVQNLDSCIFLV